ATSGPDSTAPNARVAAANKRCDFMMSPPFRIGTYSVLHAYFLCVLAQGAHDTSVHHFGRTVGVAERCRPAEQPREAAFIRDSTRSHGLHTRGDCRCCMIVRVFFGHGGRDLGVVI